MNSPIELVVIRRQSNQEFCEGFQYYDWDSWNVRQSLYGKAWAIFSHGRS